MYEYISLSNEDKKVVVLNKPFNIMVISGDPGSGKTVLSKIIVSKIAYNPLSSGYRRVLVIDPKGDYVVNNFVGEWGVRNFNRSRLSGLSCLNAHVINDFKPLLSDFLVDEFMNLGFGESSARFLFMVIRDFEFVHGGRYDKVLDFISNFPTTDYALKEFLNNNPGVDLKGRVHESVKESVVRQLQFFTDWFGNPGEPSINFDFELRRNNLIIQPSDFLKRDWRKLRAFFSVVMRKLTSAIKDLGVFVLMDEADKLCPSVDKLYGSEAGLPLPLTLWVNDFIFKEARKHGVGFIFVSQRLEFIDYRLTMEYDYYVAGHISGVKGLEDLSYNLEYGIRQFFFHDVRNNYKAVFTPVKMGMEA